MFPSDGQSIGMFIVLSLLKDADWKRASTDDFVRACEGEGKNIKRKLKRKKEQEIINTFFKIEEKYQKKIQKKRFWINL